MKILSYDGGTLVETDCLRIHGLPHADSENIRMREKYVIASTDPFDSRYMIFVSREYDTEEEAREKLREFSNFMNRPDFFIHEGKAFRELEVGDG